MERAVLESLRLRPIWRQHLRRWGRKVIQIGCDPKADSTINLLGGEPLRPVMNYMREEDEEPEELSDIAKEGYGGVLCY